jgi:hypothetical protein
MTPQERRGKRLFLILATLTILDKLAGVGVAFIPFLAEGKWSRSDAQAAGFALAFAAGFALAVVYLWQGHIWLRWLVGGACLLAGGLATFVSGLVLMSFAGRTPPDATGLLIQVARNLAGILGLFGLLYVVAGLLFLFSPSMRAFYRYQRERPRAWIESR